MNKTKIDNWVFVHGGGDPYKAPEVGGLFLNGIVTGHPVRPDGNQVTTSAIAGKRGGKVVTKNTEYELGEARADYEAAYPGARQRLLDSLPELP